MDVDLWLKGNRAPDVIASGQMIRMRSIALCLGLTTNLCHGVLQGVLHEGAESVALARGQPATPSRPSAATTPAILADISGRDFGGVRLTGGVQALNISLAGARVWTWEEPPSVPGSAATQRVMLRGDAKVSIGDHHFTAAQAVIWIEQLPDAADARLVSEVAPGGEGSTRTRQIAVYFDRVSDPGGDVASGGFSQAGDRLLVTGLVRGELALKFDSLTRGKPDAAARDAMVMDRDLNADGAAFVTESETRLARHMRKLLGVPDESREDRPELASVRRDPGAYSPLRPIRPGLSRPYEPNSPITRAAESPGPDAPSPTPLPPVEKLEPIFAKDGVISLAVNGDRMIGTGVEEDEVASPIKFIRGTKDGDESVLMLAGGVVVQYTSARGRSSIEITATRAVVFLKNSADAAGGMSFSADAVKGIYLEGDVVAVSGTYTLRGPRIFYDVENQQAVMPDAVFWTYDAERGLPLYVRARSIRQLADKQWQAEGARLATTSFTDPVFSIGARSVTITQRNADRGSAARRARRVESGDEGIGFATGERSEAATYIDARGVALRAGGVPFFPLPRIKGELDNIPLKDLRFESSSNSGAAIKTAWDIFGATGLTPPEGFKSNLLADWYFDRGPGVGNRSTWDRAEGKGSLFAYSVPTDWGRDVLASGLKKTRKSGGEFRGALLAENTTRLDERWTLQLEIGTISDENFIDAYFRKLAEEGREITNAAYLKRADESSVFSVLVKGTIDDFTPNQYLLQSQGYTVDKLPEVSYFRAADDLLAQSAPGLLTWSSEYRLSNMRLRFTDPTLAELGFDTANRAQGAFGVNNPNLSPADVLRARGYTDDDVLRADTRQEVDATFAYGPVKLNPFITGRVTAYDQKFESYNGASVDEQYRYIYSTGVRTSTQLTRINNEIDSALLDLHRTRHIVEPNMTVWYAGTNVDQSKLPVYDDQVESLASGASIKLGLDQTWQTQRGGPGRWRSVDFLKVNGAIVQSSGDADKESPLGRFFDYRPEYSQLGEFATADVAWQMTDVVGLTADTIYDLDLGQPARTSAGGVIQHSPDFSSYAEVRYINVLDATYINFGVDYKLTRRYLLGFNTTYDTDEGDFQSYNFNVRRKTPEAVIGVSVGYNNISEETSVGIIFEPAAAAAQGQSERLRNIGR